MQAARDPFSVLSHPAPDLPDGENRGLAQARHELPLLESAELLRGNKAVAIAHNGSLYRLQSTRLGKLILTK